VEMSKPKKIFVEKYLHVHVPERTPAREGTTPHKQLITAHSAIPALPPVARAPVPE
jgi:hypothetical protein